MDRILGNPEIAEIAAVLGEIDIGLLNITSLGGNQFCACS